GTSLARGGVGPVACNPRNGRLAFGAADGGIRISGAEQDKVMQLLLGHAGAVLDLAWSPDGQALASCGADETLRVWKANGTLAILWKPGGPIAALAWAPDGQRLAGAVGREIIVWDVSINGKRFQLRRGFEGPVTKLAWSPGGRWLACGSDHGKLYVCDMDA